LGVGNASASYKSTKLIYNVSWGNISLAKSQLDYEFGKDDVRISARLQARGSLPFFGDLKAVQLLNWFTRTLAGFQKHY
jgi:hypothetical protein